MAYDNLAESDRFSDALERAVLDVQIDHAFGVADRLAIDPDTRRETGAMAAGFVPSAKVPYVSPGDTDNPGIAAARRASGKARTESSAKFGDVIYVTGSQSYTDRYAEELLPIIERAVSAAYLRGQRRLSEVK